MGHSYWAAAVAANLVSPILIIVAVTGIGSFAIPDFSRLLFQGLRFIYLIIASATGLLGISCVFINLLLLVDAKLRSAFHGAFCSKTSGNEQIHFQVTFLEEEDRPDLLIQRT